MRTTEMAERSVEERETVRYVADMLDELRKMSPAAAGPALPFLIDVARLEALECLDRFGQKSSETNPPGWRSSRPARSSSKSTS